MTRFPVGEDPHHPVRIPCGGRRGRGEGSDESRRCRRIRFRFRCRLLRLRVAICMICIAWEEVSVATAAVWVVLVG